MPVNTTGSTVQYTGDGVRTTFPFTFPIGSEGDLAIKARVTATGVTTLQTLTTHYTVTKSGTNFDNGGNVEMVSAPAATITLIITRDTTQTQSTDLIYGDTHDSEAYENMVDRNTLMIQELQKQIDRCFKIPDSDPDSADMEVTNSVDRASQFAAFDASGNLIPASTITGGTAATAFMQTVLDDPDAATARATLGAFGLPEWPSFAVNRGTADQDDITGADLVEFNTELFDTHGYFQPIPTFRFTPLVAGKYLLSATIKWKDTVAADALSIYIYKNSAKFYEHMHLATTTDNESSTITAVVDANGIQDHFMIYAENAARNTSDILGAIDETYWTGCRIG